LSLASRAPIVSVETSNEHGKTAMTAMQSNGVQASGIKSVIDAMAARAVREDAAAIKPRHHRWFHGKEYESGFEVNRAVAEKMAKMTKERVTKVAEANYDRIAARVNVLPNADLRRSIAFGLIPGHVTHGACRFAQVVEDTGSGYEVVRFFLSNGDVKVDPTAGSRYLQLLDSSKETATWFGLGMRLDRDGNFIEFNRDVGENGLLFVTHDPTEAFVNIAATAVGRDVGDFRSLMAAAAVPQAQSEDRSPVAPRF
jgi:hypothetical protein